MSGLIGYGNDPIKIVSGYDTINIKEWTFDGNGNIQLPLGGNVLDHEGNVIINEGLNTGNIGFESNIIRNDVQNNPIIFETRNLASTVSSWSFEPTGSLVLPSDGALNQNECITKTTTANLSTLTPTVIWRSNSNLISSCKLIIQLEQEQVGDLTGWHTHTCEAIVASRGESQIGTPGISVYGVNYTTLSPLVTFTVQRSIANLKIEVLATLADATNPAYLRIHSVEMRTRGLE